MEVDTRALAIERRLLERFEHAVPLEREETAVAHRRADVGLDVCGDAQDLTAHRDLGVAQQEQVAAAAVVPHARDSSGLVEHAYLDQVCEQPRVDHDRDPHGVRARRRGPAQQGEQDPRRTSPAHARADMQTPGPTLFGVGLAANTA